MENRLKLSEIVRRESSPALNEDKSKMKEREREKKKKKLYGQIAFGRASG